MRARVHTPARQPSGATRGCAVQPGAAHTLLPPSQHDWIYPLRPLHPLQPLHPKHVTGRLDLPVPLDGVASGDGVGGAAARSAGRGTGREPSAAAPPRGPGRAGDGPPPPHPEERARGLVPAAGTRRLHTVRGRCALLAPYSRPKPCQLPPPAQHSFFTALAPLQPLRTLCPTASSPHSLRDNRYVRYIPQLPHRTRSAPLPVALTLALPCSSAGGCVDWGVNWCVNWCVPVCSFHSNADRNNRYDRYILQLPLGCPTVIIVTTVTYYSFHSDARP